MLCSRRKEGYRRQEINVYTMTAAALTAFGRFRESTSSMNHMGGVAWRRGQKALGITSGGIIVLELWL